MYGGSYTPHIAPLSTHIHGYTLVCTSYLLIYMDIGVVCGVLCVVLPLVCVVYVYTGTYPYIYIGIGCMRWCVVGSYTALALAMLYDLSWVL